MAKLINICTRKKQHNLPTPSLPCLECLETRECWPQAFLAQKEEFFATRMSSFEDESAAF